MKKITLLLSLLTLSMAAQNFPESDQPGSDWPNTGNGPVLVFVSGINTVSGSVTTPADGQDRFQVMLPAGASITDATFTYNTGGGSSGFLDFNSGGETINSPGGSFVNVPYGPGGTYPVLVNSNFAPGNNWSVTFTVAGGSTCDIAIGSVNTTAPSCPGGTDGTITINATCTTCAGLEYSLDNVTFQPSNTFTRGSGIYTTYVRDTGDATCNDSQTAPVTGGLDNTAPMITCPANQTGDVDGTCMFTVPDYTGMATATDNCTTPIITQNPAAGSMVGLGATTITLTANDGNGQTTDCTFTLTVEDNTAPVVTCIADDTRDSDAGVCAYTVIGTEFDATFTDNCMSAMITNDFNNTTTLDGAVLPLGATTITWTVDDGNGQTAMCTTTVTVVDNEDPTAVCQNITIELDENGNATIEGQAVPVTSVSGSLDTTDPQFARPNGNGTTCSTTTGADHFYDIFAFSIDAADMYTFSMPNNVGPDFYFLLYEGGFDPASPCTNFIEGNDDTNGTEPELNLTLNLVPGNYELVTTTFFGNAAEGPYTYSVSSAAGGNVLEAGAVSGLTIDDNSSDNCGIATITASQTDFTCADIGDNNITLTITDVNGNQSMCTAIVTVEDNTPIVISSGPVDIFTGTGPNAGDCETTVTYDPVTADSFTVEDDNCFDNATITVSQTGGLGSGASFPVGTTTEEFTLTDSNGNETVYTFDVNISDTTLPVIDCPDEVIVSGDDEGNYMIEDYTSLVSDNCSSATDLVISQEPAAGTVVTDPSTTEVTLTATDEAGNTTTCMFNLVVDETLNVADISFESGLKIYPNPTAGEITVSASKAIDAISVYDMRGRLVMQQSVNDLSEIVDMTSFEVGVYLIKITSEASIVTKRLIKK